MAYVVVGALVLAATVFWLWTRSRIGAHERALVAACRNDDAQADRLIEHERRRVSGLTREQASERALWTLRRDR